MTAGSSATNPTSRSISSAPSSTPLKASSSSSCSCSRRLLLRPVERHVLHSQLARIADQRETQRVLGAREVITALRVGAPFRDNTARAHNGDHVAFDDVFPPRVALPVMIQIDLERAIRGSGQNRAERISPGSG